MKFRQMVAEIDGEVRQLVRHPVTTLRKLLTEHATPGELARAAALGTFLATLPLINLHTVVILYAATRLRLNRVMAVAIQNLCMPPVVPVLCVQLGYFMRHGAWLREVNGEIWIRQFHLRLWEWLLGSLVAAPVIALVTGLTVFGLATLMARRIDRPSDVRREGGPGA